MIEWVRGEWISAGAGPKVEKGGSVFEVKKEPPGLVGEMWPRVIQCVA